MRTQMCQQNCGDNIQAECKEAPKISGASSFRIHSVVVHHCRSSVSEVC